MGVPLDATYEPDVGVRVDEHLHVTQIAHSGVDEEENAIDDDDVCGFDVRVFGASKVRHEIVFRLFDCLAPAECLEVRTQQVIVERVRMIPVEPLPLVEREGREVLVVGIHVDECHRRCRKQIRDVRRHRGLARARAAGDSDNERFQHADPNLF